MVLDKHLTIEEAKNEIRKLENELDLYLNKKRINFIKTQPGASKYESITSKSNEIFDKFSHYIIKDEKLDDKIYQLQEDIVNYQLYIIQEMKRISSIAPYKTKVYELREDPIFIRENKRHRTWAEISKLTNYSIRQTQRIYDEIVKGKI